MTVQTGTKPLIKFYSCLLHSKMYLSITPFIVASKGHMSIVSSQIFVPFDGPGLGFSVATCTDVVGLQVKRTAATNNGT